MSLQITCEGCGKRYVGATDRTSDYPTSWFLVQQDGKRWDICSRSCLHLFEVDDKRRCEVGGELMAA